MPSLKVAEKGTGAMPAIFLQSKRKIVWSRGIAVHMASFVLFLALKKKSFYGKTKAPISCIAKKNPQ